MECLFAVFSSISGSMATGSLPLVSVVGKVFPHAEYVSLGSPQAAQILLLVFLLEMLGMVCLLALCGVLNALKEAKTKHLSTNYSINALHQ